MRNVMQVRSNKFFLKLLFIALFFFINQTAHALLDNVVYLFAHGLYNDYTLAYYYENIRRPHELSIMDNELRLGHIPGCNYRWTVDDANDMRLWILQQPLHSFNFPDATRKGFDGNQTSLGQENEILALANAYGHIKHNNVVVMGYSRGAATVLNWLGTKKPTNIAAAIVESPYDSITNALDFFCKNAGVGWIPYGILYTSPNLFFGKFDYKGVFPIKVIQHLDPAMPLLIIASLEDALVPAASTATLYTRLLQYDYPHVYFLLLNKGKHGYLLEDQDAHYYLNAVHAFYKKYDLPHNAAFAAAGQKILSQCQPSKKEVDEALKNKKSFISY